MARKKELRPPIQPYSFELSFVPPALTAFALLGRGIGGLGHVDAVAAFLAERGYLAGVECFARDNPIDLCGGVSNCSRKAASYMESDITHQ